MADIIMFEGRRLGRHIARAKLVRGGIEAQTVRRDRLGGNSASGRSIGNLGTEILRKEFERAQHRIGREAAQRAE